MAPLVISPRSECSNPEIAFRVVVFPAPLAPSNVVIFPSCTFNDTPLRTRITPVVDDLNAIQTQHPAPPKPKPVSAKKQYVH